MIASQKIGNRLLRGGLNHGCARRLLIACVAVALGWMNKTSAQETTQPYNTQAETLPLSTPEEALRSFQLPQGFSVDVFAAEPNVRNPIAVAWDGRGRLWVAENYTYSERERRFDFRLRDRIVILADTDGDGRADTRRVFADDLPRLSSVELGLGGVWALCPPNLLFIPDRDRDDVPDGPAEVVLDGFDVAPENYHTFANGLRWGMDGWLYGRCGASCPGRIGAPGTSDEDRVPIFGGIWRWDPRSGRFEVLSHGTTNPWGHDWNAYGDGFFVNTVNGHLWQILPGAHYARPHTIDPNPRVYELIDQHADHYHFDTGKGWTDSRSAAGEHDRLGGGHAHCGAMFYLADNWPLQTYGRLFTLNLHGHRVNTERILRSGSGYVGRHDGDLFQVKDPWFRGLDLTLGPDGAVYIVDWTDIGECHEHDGVHRTSGRIYRVTGAPAAIPQNLDMQRAEDGQLIAWQNAKNEWYVRQARLALRDRAAEGGLQSDTRRRLEEMWEQSRDPVSKLRALWALRAAGGLTSDHCAAARRDGDEHVRSWGIRFATDTWPLDTILGQRLPSFAAADQQAVQDVASTELLAELVEMARRDDSGLVRLTLASTLQRLPIEERPKLAGALIQRSEDAGDHNLPLLVWYGLMPVGDADPNVLAELVRVCTWPKLRRLIVRRISEEIRRQPAPLDGVLQWAATRNDVRLHADVVEGMRAALRGWHQAPKPKHWDAFATVVETTQAAQLDELQVIFGDGRTLDELRATALDNQLDIGVRRAALATLIESRSPMVRETCEKLLSVRYLNTTAIQGLAAVDDPELGRRIARAYRSFTVLERPAVMQALVARPSFAAAMLEEMAAGRIPAADLTPFQARQIQSFGDPELTQRLTEVWGAVRESPAERRQQIEQLQRRYAGDALRDADLVQGRRVFIKVCAGCHTLYGSGGKTGPDLTGAGRRNLRYLLENIIDPSSVVSADYRMSVVQLADGRVFNGIIIENAESRIVLQTQTERVYIARDDIQDIVPSPLSLMPDGLLNPLSEQEVRDLLAYLMTRSQVALPEDPGTADSGAGAD